MTASIFLSLRHSQCLPMRGITPYMARTFRAAPRTSMLVNSVNRGLFQRRSKEKRRERRTKEDASQSLALSRTRCCFQAFDRRYQGQILQQILGVHRLKGRKERDGRKKEREKRNNNEYMKKIMLCTFGSLDTALLMYLCVYM